MTNPPLPGIEHVILLMFENRSFDNVLGALYPSTVDGGGVPKGFSNPWPGSGSIPAWNAPVGSAAWIMPYPDPNELYANMSAQIQYGSTHMQGFVADYLSAGTPEHKVKPAAIMQYYQPDNIPVTAALARTYMASDRYFGSGPVQTWPNRVFSLCGTPGYDPTSKKAYLNNTDYPDYSGIPPIDGQLSYLSIFEQLDRAGQSWS
jgi:phospholipase C